MVVIFFYEFDVIVFIMKCFFLKLVIIDGFFMYVDVCKYNRLFILYKIKYFYFIN